MTNKLVFISLSIFSITSAFIAVGNHSQQRLKYVVTNLIIGRPRKLEVVQVDISGRIKGTRFGQYTCDAGSLMYCTITVNSNIPDGLDGTTPYYLENSAKIISADISGRYTLH